MYRVLDMCYALDMPCGARRDLYRPHCEAIYRKQRLYRICKYIALRKRHIAKGSPFQGLPLKGAVSEAD